MHKGIGGGTESATALASHEVPGLRPFLTVGIPHYKWRRHLEIVLSSIFEQEFPDFEIVVSDDNSPDDSAEAIPAVLAASGRQFRYYRQPVNLGYDANVRFCLASAQGRYVLLLGNDDALGSPTTLRELADALRALDCPEVAFTNFEEWSSPGSVVKRALATRVLGSGPDAAIRFFRSFSFVSGLIFDREAAKAHDTAKWDRSIYYQIYLASRIVVTGGRVASLAINAIRKDILVNNQTVVNYATKLRATAASFAPRHTGLDSVIRVTADAILPLVPPQDRSRSLRRIVAQVLTITYPFWLLEYRRVSRWSFAVGVARSLTPGKLLREHALKPGDRAYLVVLYWTTTALGLLLPVAVFEAARERVAHLLRRRHQSAGGGQ